MESIVIVENQASVVKKVIKVRSTIADLVVNLK